MTRTPMPDPCPVPETLRRFVREALCVQENLLPERTELTESPLLRGDRVCGVQFVLHGPRSLRLTAIWDADRGRILCYDAGGERFLDVLVDGAGDAVAA